MLSIETVLLTILSLTFTFSAVTKILGFYAFRQTLIEFGVPNQLTFIGATGIIAVEMIVAVGLVFTSTRDIAAGTGAMLLTLFNCLILANLVVGNRPECNCFGNLDSSKVGPVTLARNIALTAVALTIIFM